MIESRPAGETSLLELLNILLRRRRLFGILALAFVAGAVAFRFLMPSYFAESRFTPQSSQDQPSRFIGIAAQLGFNLDFGAGGESPDFYAQLLRSRELLDEAVRTPFAVPDGDGSGPIRGTLVQIYRIEEPDSAERLRRAVDRLRHNVSVASDPKSQLVALRVSARSRLLAEAINRRLLDLVNEFNLQKRQTQAAAERKFVEGRLAEARHELEETELEMERFLQRNRTYAGAPQLEFEANRLQRRISLRQDVYSSLSEAYERARLDEVRNTPLVTVMDSPEGSGRRTGTLVTTIGLGLLAAAAVWVVLALVLEALDRARRAGTADYLELRRIASGLLEGSWLRRLRLGRTVPPA